jgi:hypothetical protein
MSFFRNAAWGAAMLAGACLVAASAEAQSPSLSYVPAVAAGDAIPDLPNGAVGPAGQYASAAQLGAYLRATPTSGNLVIGGNADTNLWQDGTAGVAFTTSVLYGGPDEWVGWSGTSTQGKIIEDTADTAPSGYLDGFKLQRTSGQTGVVQMCMAHEIRSVIATQAQGATVELDFHDLAGATFSAANAAFTAAIVTGTGANEGTTDLAYGYNAGGGGSQGWTGQANAAVGSFTAGALNRNALVAAIPANAKEIGVVFCWTPAGTAGTNDYLALWGVQLTRNPATGAYSCSPATGGTATGTTIPCAAFDRTRTNVMEAQLQYADYYRISEGTAGTERGLCRSRTTTTCSWDVKFPVPMNAAPTMSYTAGFAAETTAAGGTLGNCTGLAADTTVSSALASVTDAYALCTATTIPAAGTVDQVYDNGGSGAVKASARL